MDNNIAAPSQAISYVPHFHTARHQQANAVGGPPRAISCRLVAAEELARYMRTDIHTAIHTDMQVLTVIVEL